MASLTKVFLYSQNGKVAYGIRQFIVDDESGITELPTDVHIGSSCLVIETGDIYILNSKSKWIKIGSKQSESEEPGEDDKPSNIVGEAVVGTAVVSDSDTTPQTDDSDIVGEAIVNKSVIKH